MAWTMLTRRSLIDAVHVATPRRRSAATEGTGRLGMGTPARKVTEQLEPERARSCRNAITMAPAMIDEIRLRAHARPLDEPEP
jgi:hypothetical protein